MDRVDLNTQTSNEFQSFISHNKNELLENLNQKDGKTLAKIFDNGIEKLIITTIQKMSDIPNNQKLLHKIMNKTLIFIIDECHRSTAGTMLKKIKNHFKNSIMIGFSGTPIFENEERKTANIFGNQLDVYNMKNAIEDKNVLPFNIRDFFVSELDNVFYKNNEIFRLPNNNPQKLEKIMEIIQEMHHSFTINNNYNAIFAFDNIENMLTFYKMYLDKKIEHIFMTPIFSNENTIEEINQENENSTKKLIEEFKPIIIERYNQKFDKKFDVENFDKYINDVQYTFKDYDPIKGINIVLVVDMLLTGYDSPKTNTIYINKKLKNHSLIQAFSRTNRNYKYDKKHGYVINFSLSTQEIKEAFLIYANSNLSDIQNIVYGDTYKKVYNDFLHLYEKIKLKINEIYDFEKNEVIIIKDDEKIKDIFSNLKNLFITHDNLKTFYEYTEEKPITDEIFNDLNLYKKIILEYKIYAKKENKILDEFEIIIHDSSDIKYQEIIVDKKYLDLLSCLNSNCKINYLNFDKDKVQSDYLKILEELDKDLKNGKITKVIYDFSFSLNETWYEKFLDIFFNNENNLSYEEKVSEIEKYKLNLKQDALFKTEIKWFKEFNSQFPEIDLDLLKEDWNSRIKEKNIEEIWKSPWLKKLRREVKTITTNDTEDLINSFRTKLETVLLFIENENFE